MTREALASLIDVSVTNIINDMVCTIYVARIRSWICVDIYLRHGEFQSGIYLEPQTLFTKVSCSCSHMEKATYSSSGEELIVDFVPYIARTTVFLAFKSYLTGRLPFIMHDVRVFRPWFWIRPVRKVQVLCFLECSTSIPLCSGRIQKSVMLLVSKLSSDEVVRLVW